jgi:hypothetical protein
MGIFPREGKLSRQNQESNLGPHIYYSEVLTTKPRGWSKIHKIVCGYCFYHLLSLPLLTRLELFEFIFIVCYHNTKKYPQNIREEFQIFKFYPSTLLGSPFYVLRVNTFYFLMFVPCIIRRSRNNQQLALNYTTPLFNILALTCLGSSLPSSGSFLDPSELLETQIE